MNLSQLVVHARQRSNWESVDLGILLARRHWLLMATLWLIPAAAVFSLLLLIFPDRPNLALLVIWWLKPVFERLPLLLASRQLFAQVDSFADALKLFFRANRCDALSWISWRRLNFTRSFDLPLTVLEQAKGSVRTARQSLLHRKTAGTASWLHIVGAHVELILSIGLWALVYMMLPEQIEVDWLPLVQGDNQFFMWLANGVSLLVMAAVAPFYVCAGFMLYIGRRVELEAWDVEIQFRKLRERFIAKRGTQKNGRLENNNPPSTPRKPSSVNTTLSCLFALLFCFSLAMPQPALADVITPAQAEEQIDEVMAEDDFHQKETVRGWRLKDFEETKYHFPEWVIAIIEWLEGLGWDDDSDETEASWVPLLAGIVEVILWILALALVVWLAWHCRKYIRRALGLRTRTINAPVERPETLFGLDVRDDSLPDDVTAEVLALWERGRQREAISLLYRASLAHLINRYNCPFQDHHTEAECAQLVHEESGLNKQITPKLVQLFSRLTQVWQHQAYAHRAPATPLLESLCRDWLISFSASPTDGDTQGGQA
ncbi:hypothetical protein Mag101_16710 [Microbulbifer agarilyticus]|uniref:Protein-glutamine gamma-glutamyltransferase-like C-terminal domain-containing protein n=1 Tax=Microbulbifer agarilyticus TaxID=260552 RepID=A0A1Q2M8M2_9GAMM|nr:DUF4129 domain-containing protein [Microbulbifer agarilyticus]AQQ69083.1 hypothetical protein Mag101_16710 [Microbulbifer agarilyticus]